jgi:cation diffusion facilitator family transporter
MAHLRRPLQIALGLNTAVLVMEGAGGVHANSLSLIMDSVHNLSDELGLGFLVLAYTLRSGLSGRFLRSANFFNSAGLLAISGFFIWQAIERVAEPVHVLGIVPVLAGVLGAIGNWGVARVLREPSREDAAIRIAYVHNLGDTLLSLAPVMAGGLTLAFRSFVFDPLIALGLGAVIAVTTVRALVGSRGELLWPGNVVCGAPRS